MDIYLIRHTSVQVESGICYGQTDVALADDFASAFEPIQSQLSALPENTVIISSPLQRCLQLAKKLSHGNSVITDKRIMELNFGEWEMQKWDDIEQAALQKWMNDYVNVAPPNGESFETLFERCQDFWENLIAKPCSAVIVVTHLGVIRALLAHVLEMPLQKSLCIQINHGAVSKLKYHQSEKVHHYWITIEYLNG
ncbi:MAG: alpha-ribazole phosphatase [Candidatus Parabeggiatoa sp. nov. 1]|nr:MAG: alpha-ribazole phosphatase [Gammaproteobacteria bacterium]